MLTRAAWIRSCTFITALSALTVAFGACSQQPTFRDEQSKESDLDAQVTAQRLGVVAGKYCGTVTLTDANQNVQVVLKLSVQNGNIHANNNDPASTTEQPELSGTLEFPILSGPAGSANYAINSEILAATGNVSVLDINFGDYKSDGSPYQFNLPFSVSTHPNGNFGQLEGNLVNGHITGLWDSIFFEQVGTFDVTACPATDSNGSST